MSTVAAVIALGDALALAQAINSTIQAAQLAGREVTPQELVDARNRAIVASVEAREAANKAQEREQRVT